jgi:hypothetical protein
MGEMWEMWKCGDVGNVEMWRCGKCGNVTM